MWCCGARPKSEDEPDVQNTLQEKKKESAQCWICLGGEEDIGDCGPFIQPCSCRGGQALCHRKCMEDWLKARSRQGAAPRAEQTWGAWTRHYLGKGLRRQGGFQHILEDVVLEGQARQPLESLTCGICGERYATRASSLRDLNSEQRKQLASSLCGALLSITLPMFVMYVKLKNMFLKMDVFGYSGADSSGFLVWMVYLSAAMAVCKFVFTLWGMVVTFQDEVRLVRSETLTVESRGEVRDQGPLKKD